MKPKMIPNAVDVAKRAWSVRLMGGAVVADAVGGTLSRFDMNLGPIPHDTLTAIGGILTLAALVARFVVQRRLS